MELGDQIRPGPGYRLPEQIHTPGWNDLRPKLFGHLDFPVGVVHQPVVVSAEQHRIVEVGITAVDPCAVSSPGGGPSPVL